MPVAAAEARRRARTDTAPGEDGDAERLPLRRVPPDRTAQSGLATPIDEELEGLGSQHLFSVDLARTAQAVPPPDPATWLERTTYNAAMTARIVPYMVG